MDAILIEVGGDFIRDRLDDMVSNLLDEDTSSSESETTSESDEKGANMPESDSEEEGGYVAHIISVS